jgi:hypothetical protein
MIIVDPMRLRRDETSDEPPTPDSVGSDIFTGATG